MKSSRYAVIIRLRAIQQVFRLNDAELSARIGVGKTAVANWVSPNDKRIITRKAAENLCDEFNVTLDWIYRGKTAMIPMEILAAERKLLAQAA